MVMINRATKELTLKIVYYGPGLCGKTTNLEYIYETANPERKGKLLTVTTETDRTLFFDFLPVELGSIRGMKVRIQLYTVPGQVFYDATRRIVLRGSDGIVFVCDSQKIMMDANIESIENLKTNLKLNSLDPDSVPLVIQYNKQDLKDLASVEELQKEINWRDVPYFLSVATIGDGVNETMRKIIEMVIKDFHAKQINMKAGGSGKRIEASVQEKKPADAEVAEEMPPVPEDSGEVESPPDESLEQEAEEHGESDDIEDIEEIEEVEDVEVEEVTDDEEEEVIDLDSVDEESEEEGDMVMEEIGPLHLLTPSMEGGKQNSKNPPPPPEEAQAVQEVDESVEEPAPADEENGMDNEVRVAIVREALKDLSLRLKGIADETERVRKILNNLKEKLEGK